MSNEVQVTLTVEEREAIKSIGKLQKSVDEFAKKSESAIKKTDLAVASFVGNLAGNLVGGAIQKIGSSISSFFGGAIKASLDAESALNKLAAALKASGSFSQAALRDFDAFAKVIETTTKFDGDLVLSQLAVAKSFGATNEQAKLVLSTATQLSTALGVSLESATEQLSGTLNGTIGRLGKVVPELKALSEEQLRAGEGLRILSDRFKGIAEGDAKAFEGQTVLLGRAIGDLQEEIGNLVTTDPLIKGLFKDAITLTREWVQIIRDDAPVISQFFQEVFGGPAKDDVPKIRQEIEALNATIDRLTQSAIAAKENSNGGLIDSLAAAIFGSQTEGFNEQLANALDQKRILEEQITKIEKQGQETRKQNFIADAESRVERSKRLYQEQLALDKAVTAQKDKEAKAQRDIQNSVLGSTSQFLSASTALFKNNSREQKTISIGVATIDAYVAANKALATLPPPASFAAAAAAIATGLANVAKITSVGSFQTGGFIPGNSYSGDRLTANVNSGEAVLNASQQRNFMELANNGVAGNNASIDLLDEIRNLKNAIMQQPVVVAVSGREIARVVRDERAAGFAI